MTIHPELKCECCGYVPDDEDIQKTNYHLTECPICGRKVCDLCIGITYAEYPKEFRSTPPTPETLKIIRRYMKCDVCRGRSKFSIGKNRKWWLADEI